MYTTLQCSRNSCSSNAQKKSKIACQNKKHAVNQKRRKSPRVTSQVYSLTLMLDVHLFYDFHTIFPPDATSPPGAAACPSVFQISLGVKALKVGISAIHYWILHLYIHMFLCTCIYIYLIYIYIHT